MRALKSERNTRIFHMNITYNNVNLCIIYHLLSSQIKLDGALWYWLRLNKVYHECGTSKCSVFFFFFCYLIKVKLMNALKILKTFSFDGWDFIYSLMISYVIYWKENIVFCWYIGILRFYEISFFQLKLSVTIIVSET